MSTKLLNNNRPKQAIISFASVPLLMSYLLHFLVFFHSSLVHIHKRLFQEKNLVSVDSKKGLAGCYSYFSCVTTNQIRSHGVMDKVVTPTYSFLMDPGST